MEILFINTNRVYPTSTQNAKRSVINLPCYTIFRTWNMNKIETVTPNIFQNMLCKVLLNQNNCSSDKYID